MVHVNRSLAPVLIMLLLCSLAAATSADDEREDTINDAWVYMGGLRSLGSYQLGAFTIGLGAALTVLEQRPNPGARTQVSG